MVHMVQDNTYVTYIIQTYAAGFIANIGCYKIGMQLASLFENTKHELVCLSALRNVSKILIRHMVFRHHTSKQTNTTQLCNN